MRRLKQSRRELFESLDRPNALPLPQQPYEYAEWYKAKVNVDYHIEIDSHFYSISYKLLHERLDVRLTATTLEAFYKGERVAAHARSYVKGKHTTLSEHMPPAHRAYAEWSPARFIQWAGKIGEATSKLIENILSNHTYPEQGYRTCLGIIHLERHFKAERVEAAAERALKFNACSYRSMKAILTTGLDQQKNTTEPNTQLSLPIHENIRGKEYYQ
jgi:transposase